MRDGKAKYVYCITMQVTPCNGSVAPFVVLHPQPHSLDTEGQFIEQGLQSTYKYSI